MINSYYDLTAPFILHNIHTICQPCCLQIPEQDNGVWDIQYPDVDWQYNTMVIMHCQDFVNVDENGCRELQLMEKHFGDRAHQVVVVVWNLGLDTVYSGPLNVVYFPSHSYEILANLSNAEDRWITNFLNTRKYKFQSLNGVAKPHRVQTFERLNKLDSGIISLHPNKPIAEFTYDQHLSVTNEENFLRLQHIYANCDVNVVTESIYDSPLGIITEKSIFAWLSLQVPILIGYKGIVAHARSLGFDMFDDIVDHSYDSESNDVRVASALDRNRDLLISGTDRIKLQGRLLYNQRHALTWPQRMIDQYQSQITAIIDAP